MIARKDKAVQKQVQKERETWGEDGTMVVVVGQKESLSGNQSSVLIFRFPKKELWLPKSQIRPIDHFCDAGFSWMVYGVPKWLYLEEASKDRNLYEERIEEGRPVTGPGIPVELRDAWTPVSRSHWLHGQIDQLVSKYGADWATNHGELMSGGVQVEVDPSSKDDIARLQMSIPVRNAAEEVIGEVQEGIRKDLGNVLKSSIDDNGEKVKWRAEIRAPRLVWS